MNTPPQAATWAPVIDTHAHVYVHDLSLAQHATHAPKHDFTLEQYLAELDASSVAFGVLTAPSFLGTNNDYLIEALRRNKRLRGTAIVDPDISPVMLRAMAADHVVGIRYSLVGYPGMPDFTAANYQRLLKHLRDLDWYVHVLAESAKLAVMLPLLTASGVKLVVDHFGARKTEPGPRDPGIEAVYRAIEGGQTWVKLAAPYRTNSEDPGVMARNYRAAAGAERLLWGSDWPWVGHETRFTYADTIRWFEDWIPDVAVREAIGQTGLRLHGLA